MIGMLAFVAVGLILYFVADWLLQRIEIVMKRRLEYRSLIFFGILLALALVVFPLIQRYAAN
jgi:uncharacterized membrane protein YedE/YeeE